ncbi:MAG TPA: CBS domain-containing protein [Anaeromyxobacteraceae bacterium]|nr:CBS domain-containing protein [Anaeromyxobacteraceae bacterium]
MPSPLDATARDLLAAKNSAVVYTCAPETTVAEACRILRDRRVGCLVVVRGSEVLGLISEREVALRTVAAGLDPLLARVSEVMAAPVARVPLEAPVEEVEALLRARRARYLLVVGRRGLLGLVSQGDLARYYAARERALSVEAPGPGLH